jgi:hypothetical protein
MVIIHHGTGHIITITIVPTGVIAPTIMAVAIREEGIKAAAITTAMSEMIIPIAGIEAMAMDRKTPVTVVADAAIPEAIPRPR